MVLKLIDPNFIAATTGGPFRFVVLVELIVAGNEPIRLTTDAVNTVVSGATYYPGIIDNISAAKSSPEINDTGISVKLSGIDDAFLSIASGGNFINSECRVYLLAQEYLDHQSEPAPRFLHFDGQPLLWKSQPISFGDKGAQFKNEGVFLLFDGVIASPPSLAFGGETSLSIAVQSRMVAKDRQRSERYADADQQKKHPGDLGMQYATEVGNKSVRWPAASWFRNQE